MSLKEKMYEIAYLRKNKVSIKSENSSDQDLNSDWI